MANKNDYEIYDLEISGERIKYILDLIDTYSEEIQKLGNYSEDIIEKIEETIIDGGTY